MVFRGTRLNAGLKVAYGIIDLGVDMAPGHANVPHFPKPSTREARHADGMGG